MIQQKIETATWRLLAIVVATIALVMMLYVPAYGDTPSTCVQGTEASCPVNSATNCNLNVDKADKAVLQNCTDPAATNADCVKSSTDGSTQCNFIKNYLQPFINFLSALVGVAVTISIVVGGIQYGSSAGDSAKVSAAKNRIRNSIIALLAFLFLYAMMNFLIPGGII